MFFSTLIGDNTKYVRLCQFNHEGSLFYPVLVDTSSAERKGFGIRPVNSGELNQFRDKDCDHINLRGELITLSETSVRNTGTPNGILGTKGQLRTRATPEPWVWYSTIHTLGSPSYKKVSDRSKPWWARYWSSVEVTVDPRTNPVLVEYRISVSNTQTSPLRISYSYRMKVEVDFQKNRYRVGTATVSGDDVTPKNWEDIIIPVTWLDMLGTDRILSTGPVSHPKFDLNFISRIFEKPQFSVGIPSELQTFGDLVQDAVDSTRALDINTPAFVLDFLKAKDTILGIWKVAKGDLSPKALASLYLSFTYGIKLTVADTKELVKAIKKAQRDVPDKEVSIVRRRAVGKCRAYYTAAGMLEGTYEYSYKLYYDPYPDPFRRQVRQLFQWDVFPSFQNLWDYIPFSFVVDWFIKVEDELERWDHNVYITTLRIISNITSTKFTYPLPMSFLTKADGTQLLSTLDVVIYKRRVSRTPPKPISRLNTPTGPFNNFVEGSALIIQRLF